MPADSLFPAGFPRMRVARRAACVLVALGWLAGCDDIRFGYESGNRFAVPEVATEPGSQGAMCFDDLEAADAQVRPDPHEWERASRLGSMSRAAFQRQERERQREWDQSYCRRQAECHTLAAPEASATEVSDRVELCLSNRAQRRVAMEL